MSRFTLGFSRLRRKYGILTAFSGMALVIWFIGWVIFSFLVEKNSRRKRSSRVFYMCQEIMPLDKFEFVKLMIIRIFFICVIKTPECQAKIDGLIVI